MAETTEQKLNMSLDDLVKKERSKRPQFHPVNGGPGPQRHQNRNNQQGPMGNWPWRGGSQQSQQPGMHGGRQGRQGYNQQGQHQQQQQHWQDMGGQQQPYQQPQQQRGSVFSRLGGGPDLGPQQHMQQQQHYSQQQQQQQPYHQRRQQQQHGGYMRQQQQQQPQQNQNRPVQPPPKPVKPKLQCVEDEEGNASLFHQDYCIIFVSPSGDMVLDSGEDHSPERCAAFNIALSHFNIAVREAPQAAGAAADAQPAWNVSEGHRLTRFTDGMRIPSRGPLTTNRAAVLLAAYGENSDKAAAAAAAAQEASRRAAIAAGLLPESAGGAEGGAAEDVEAARVRRLQAQGRYMPY